MRRLLLAALLAAALGVLVAGPAGAQLLTATCGDTISQPGTWNVERNCAGAGITIAASDVVLKLNGHTLNGGGSGDGIAIDSESDIRIVGPGKFANYQYGLNFAYVESSRVDRVKIVGSTGHGVAVYDSGDNVFKYVTVKASQYHGFTLNGSNGNVLEEDVSNGNGSNGIYLASSSGNRVTYDTVNGNGQDGVDVADIGNGAASGNKIEHDTANGNYAFGFALESTTSGNSVSYSSAHGNGFADAVDQTCDLNSFGHDKFGSLAGCV